MGRVDSHYTSSSWRHPWDPVLKVILRRASAMANTTPLVTTVTKPAINPVEVNSTPRVNIQEFCEEHYEDIFPIIMEKVRHDRRKDVHTRLDFGEGPKERIREDSYYSNTRARATEPGRKTDSRDSPRGRSRTRSLAASRDGRHKDRECLRITRESYGDSFTHSYQDGSHHHSMKRKRDKSPQSSASRSDSSDGKHRKSRRHPPTDEDDLKRPWMCEEENPFMPRICNFESSRKTRMPNNVKTYDGTGDPEDHVKVFQEAAQVERWAMPTWCHMFNSTLIGAARVWFDELPPESIDGYKDLRAAQTGRMKGAPECMRISGFMHGVNNPELTKRLNEYVPKTMEEMMITTIAFIRGEAAAASKKKGHVSWKPQDQSKRHSADKRKRSSNKFYDFHNDKGHSTDECMKLKKQIEELVRAGKLSHLIKEIKQGRDQSKAGKKETAVKDKPTEIYMVQSWQRKVKQKVTQSFERVGEIAFPKLAANNGTEGPLVVEAEMDGHIIHRMYIDGGSSMVILYEHYFNQLRPEIRSQMVPATTSLTGFSCETIWPLGQLRLLVTIGDATHSTRAWMNFMVVKSMSPYNGIIRRPGLKAIQAVPSTVHGMLKFPFEGGIVAIRSTILIPAECTSVTTSPVIPEEEKSRPANFTVALHPDFPDQEVVIGGSLSKKGRTALCSILKKNLDIFAWQPSDMTGVPRSVAEHRLNIREGYLPVRQKKRGQAPERAKAIQAEFQKLVDAKIMREVYYHDLLSNPVMDCYPLPEIDWKVESLCGYPFKCFLDAYKGYHQIQLAEADEEKTAFHTGQGVYCYTKMPFGLKNAGATYQRLMDKAFESQVGWNIEVYVDDLVVKSYTEAEMMRDIEETFRTLRKVNMKLNPKKCSFGLAEGVFLGYVITLEGLKPCPDKTAVVLQLPSQRTIKESDFRWTAEAEQAFQQLKQHLSELPLLVAPKPQEEMIMYLFATYGAVSAILMTEKGTTQTPIYFISRALQGSELNYSPMEKLVLSLVFIAKRLRRRSLASRAGSNNSRRTMDVLIDSSSCMDGSGAGLILTNPEGVEFTYALRFQFTAFNNEAEYEALVVGLRIAVRMGVKNVQVNVDSKLVANQVLGTYVAKEDNMIKYLEIVRGLISGFTTFSIIQVLVEVLENKSIKEKEVATMIEDDGPTWMTQLMDYLKEGVLPGDKKEAKKLRLKARQYELMEGVLYRRSFLTPWLRCVGPLQADYVMREIHKGSCSLHAGPRSVVAKAVRLRRAREGQVPDSRHGLLHEVDRRKDNDKRFADNPLKDWCDKLNITQRFALVKLPQSNGLVERVNRSLEEGIKARLGEGNKNWVEELPHVLWAYRTMIKSSHGDTPFSLTYRTEAVIPTEIRMSTYRTAAIDVVNNDQGYA
nr:reverse transcriptase domain-containing protein [Tanacetum cinerariifolium]